MDRHQKHPDRRDLLLSLGAGSLALMAPRLSFAALPGEKRFVFFILRGGMDGLAAVIPTGDPQFKSLRGPFLENMRPVPLDGFFSLHEDLAPLLPLYQAGDLLPVQAVASDHRGRSHFEAQDVLEAGLAHPNSSSSGWLNRLLADYERQSGRARLGLALGPTIPYALRGETRVNSAATEEVARAPAAFVDRVATLWNADPVLGPALMATMEGENSAMMGDGKRGDGIKAMQDLARLAAARLAAPQGPRIAVLELNGFDTHSGEEGRLRQQFRALSAGFLALEEGLRPVWRDTVILALSEFGRTAQPNGSGGTDHGTAGAGFLLGGAVQGGRVLADWPGLKSPQLFERRDLAPTLHIAALYKAVAAQHLGIGNQGLARIFPDAAGIRPVDILRTV